MKITINTSMDKIPTHCGECIFRPRKGMTAKCFFVGNVWEHVNKENKTLHQDCPIVREPKPKSRSIHEKSLVNLVLGRAIRLIPRPPKITGKICGICMMDYDSCDCAETNRR